MKVWKDVDEVVKATIEVPKELWECEEEMKKKPKCDKSKKTKKKLYK